MLLVHVKHLVESVFPAGLQSTFGLSYRPRCVVCWEDPQNRDMSILALHLKVLTDLTF